MTTKVIQRILVPTDLSDFSKAAAKWAVMFHRRLGSRITLLYANAPYVPIAEELSTFARVLPSLRILGRYGHPRQTSRGGDRGDGGEDRRGRDSDGNPRTPRRLAAELLVVYVADPLDEPYLRHLTEDLAAWVDPAVRERCRYSQVIRRGDAAEQVLEIAGQTDADLIVIGAQHRRFLDATVLGTTTERVVRFAKQPVWTVFSHGVVQAAGLPLPLKIKGRPEACTTS